MTGVRIRDGDFEGRCEYCGEYLPLTAEFWPVKADARAHGLAFVKVRVDGVWRYSVKEARFVAVRGEQVGAW